MGSNNTALSVRQLSKAYQIGHNRTKPTTMGEMLVDRIRNPIQRVKTDTFWALRDMSFDVQHGEVVGIIGRNGAGKSTLLKILSSITEPTGGEIDIYGKVGSLLEVGTGFHPELTGRENIYLNGAILGMRRKDIARQFDAIVDFADVEQFLDTPVKRYSSGMYVRLAFAVAAHLNPQILIVDEVLAVGDATFQRKCLGKMSDVASKEGRTVLFVSHNMTAVTALCNRAILLNAGQVQMDGDTAEVTQVYHANSFQQASNSVKLDQVERSGNGKLRFEALRTDVESLDGERIQVASPGCTLSIETDLHAYADVVDTLVAVIVYDANFYRLIDINTALQAKSVELKSGQTANIRFVIRDLLLKPGSYFIGLWCGRHGSEEYDHIEYATRFAVMATADFTKSSENFPGPYRVRFESYFTIQNHLGASGDPFSAAQGPRSDDNLIGASVLENTRVYE
jgi:lipopolysaccharide transport system ATP-binding protein